MENIVRKNVQQKGNSKITRKYLDAGSKTRYVTGVGGSATNLKTVDNVFSG